MSSSAIEILAQWGRDLPPSLLVMLSHILCVYQRLLKGRGINLARFSFIFTHFHRFCSGVYRFSSICVVSSRFFLGFLIFRCFFNGFRWFFIGFWLCFIGFVIFPCFSMFLFGLLVIQGLFRVYLRLVYRLFRVCLGFIYGWFRGYLGLV